MWWSKSSFEPLYICIMIDKVPIFHPMAMKLTLLLLLNNKSVISYSDLVYYIISYKTNGRRVTAISISDVCNGILYNMTEMNILEVISNITYA